MLKLKSVKNHGDIMEGHLFSGYSKKKLMCLSETYEELAKLYRNIPVENKPGDDRKDMLYRKELIEAQRIFANQLEEISGAFADVADTVWQVSLPLERKKKALVQHLRKYGIQVKEMVFLENSTYGYFGSGADCANRISIEARAMGKNTVSVDELSGLLSVFFDRRLTPSADSAVLLGRSYDIFIFEDEPSFCVLSGVSRAIKDGEKISGDNFSFEEYNQNQIVLMLADGMGSGAQACKDSQTVIEFMEKFFEAGFPKEKAFSMVNGAIASQSSCRNLTTLDLCSINLFNGDAEFIKAGAAPSFIKRGSAIEEISVDTLPLGSINELSPLMQSVRVYDYDMLIMLSDGISDAFANVSSDCLKSVIAKNSTLNPKEMADYLLQYAINCQGGHIPDDMTVLACSFIKN